MNIDRNYFIGLQSFNTEEDYRASSSLNYSLLKQIPNGPFCLVDDAQKSMSKALYVGDYVDKYFTARESINDIYDVSRSKIELNSSLESLFQSFCIVNKFDPSIDECVSKSREIGIYASIKDDEKLKTRITSDFFEKLKIESEKSGKILLTQEQYGQAVSAIHNICINDDAMGLITERRGEILIPQFKWEFEIKLPSGRKRKFKVMFDFLKFNLNYKRIIGIDIKTGERPTHKFGDQFLEFGYGIQGELYFLGMCDIQKRFFPDWNKCEPNDFKFIYSRKKSDNKSVIITLSNKFLSEYSEFWKILDDADWYIENQIFDTHRIIAESSGIIEIDKLL